MLRFNTRGTWSEQGTSEGEFDNGEGETYDVAAAIEYAEFHDLPHIWLVGWSFGTDLALMHGHDPVVQGASCSPRRCATASPPTSRRWAESGQAGDRAVPEHDDYLQPAEARERFAPLAQAEVVGVAGAKHLWVGDAERCSTRSCPGRPRRRPPLPREWDGPMETADTSGYAAAQPPAYKDTPVPQPGE